MGAHLVIYGILYAITLIFALMVLFLKDTVKSAMALVGVMLAIAANYFVMGMEFVGAIQIIVYAGAIMVLFLFVIMLLNMREREVAPWYLRKARYLGGFLALLFLLLVGYGVYSFTAPSQAAVPSPMPSIPGIATLLTTKYALPFLLTSLLLLVAVIGAVVMGRRQDPETGEEYFAEDVEV